MSVIKAMPADDLEKRFQTGSSIYLASRIGKLRRRHIKLAYSEL